MVVEGVLLDNTPSRFSSRLKVPNDSISQSTVSSLTSRSLPSRNSAIKTLAELSTLATQEVGHAPEVKVVGSHFDVLGSSRTSRSDGYDFQKKSRTVELDRGGNGFHFSSSPDAQPRPSTSLPFQKHRERHVTPSSTFDSSSRNRVWNDPNVSGGLDRTSDSRESGAILNPHNSMRSEDYLLACEHFVKEYVRLGRLAISAGNLEQAKSSLHQALDLVNKHHSIPSSLAAFTFLHVGILLKHLGQVAESMEYFQRSLQLCSSLDLRAQPEDVEIDLVDVLLQYAGSLSKAGQHEGALRQLLSARDDLLNRIQDVKDTPDKRRLYRLLTIVYFNLGAEHKNLKRQEESWVWIQRSFETATKYLNFSDPLYESIHKIYIQARESISKGSQKQQGTNPTYAERTRDEGTDVSPLKLWKLNESDGRSRHLANDSSTVDDHALSSTNVGDSRVMREQKKIDQWNPNVDHSHRSKANSEAWNSERSMITPNGLHSLHAIHRGSWAASARRTRAWELKSEGEEERRRDGDSEIFGSDGEASLPLHLSSSRLDESEYLKRNPTADRQVQTMLALPLEEEEEGRAGLRGSNIFKRREGGDVNSISNKGEATDPTMFDMLHMVQEKQQHGNSSSALRYLPKGNKKGLVDYLQTSFPTHSSHQKEMSTQFDGIPATSGAGEDFLSEQRVRDLIMSRAAESRRKEMSRRRPFSTDESWETEDSLPPHLNRTYKRHLLRTQEAMRVYEDGAVLLQCCYRCHAARRQAAQLMRRPVHLESMYRNQIYAFAALLQSNVRCMLARLRVGRLAAEKRAKQTRDWQMRRRRAALIIQTFFVKITQHMKRMRRREDKKYGPAATCIQSAWRMRTCRRRRNDLYEHAARSVGNFCHQLRQDRTKRIQCAYRSHLARKFMTELHREHRRLLCCPGSTVWRRQGLSIGSLKQRLNLEERCVLRLQAQHMTEMTKRLSRRLIAYRCRRKEEESVMVVQSAVRCWMARVAARTMWTSCQDDWSVKLHDFSAACIQRAVLNYWSRRRLVLLRHRKLSLIQHHSAIDIQRVFAGHLARNLVRARICFLDLQQRLASSKDQLAVRLQCCVRSWQARRNVIRRVFWRDSAMAAVMIQSAARSWRARSEFNEHAMDVMGRRRCCSALVLQAWSFSNPFARQRPIARYWKKERERAAERLVGTCKMHLARRRMRERRDEVLSRAGALLLQAVFRGHVGRSTFAKVLKKEQRKEMQRAALKIQCVVRCWRAREGLKRQKMFWMEAGRLRRARELIIRSNAAKRIQAATRMWIQRHVALPPLLAQRELDAAAVLVRVYRGHTGRRDCKGRRTERRLEAVRILQCAYREHLARLMLRTAIDLSSKIPVLKEQRRRLQAAVCIQHAYFAHVARLMFVERAGDILISHARMRRLQSIYRRQQAALSIAQRAGGRMRQELLRRVVAANLLRAQVKRSLIVPKFRMQRAGMHISSFLLRNLLHRKLIFEMATSTISANLKRKFWRRRFLRYHAESRLSSFLLRSILSTRRASYRSASVHIQSVMRGHLDRRWVRANQKPLLQHRWHIRCLLALQSAYRGHVGRRKFRVLWRVREEERAIASLQAVLRRHVQRTRYWKIVDGMQKDAAITVVQQQCRRKMARRRMQQRRTEKRLNDAAERLQSVVRGHMGRKAARAWRVFLWQSTAALRVEIAYRARLGRKRLREAREERRRETAALVVQKYTRGMIGRSRARDRQWEKLEERSAKKIQTVARGMLGRKESRRRRREVELLHEFKVQQCIIIQCCIRQKIARLLLLKAEEEAAERELMRDCYATLLQCNVRMFVSRSRKERRRRAIETLQSFARMLQAKKKCRARRAILSRDSLYTPPHLLRPDRYKVPPGTQLRRPSKAAGKRFRAEATPGKIAQASSESWESRQQRAVKAFKSAPQVQAFFSDLQGRGVSRGATAERVQMKPPPAGGTGGVSQMKPPPAASMMRHSQQAATRSAPGTAMGPSKTAGRARLPPRFTKTSDGGKSSKAASASKRPKARGSDSERESGSSDEAPKPRAPVMVHRRSNYNKNDISPDPSSDSDQRGKSKGVKPLKKKSETVQPDKPKLEASRSKDAAPSRPLAATVPAPSSSAAGSKLKDLSSSKSAAEQQVEAAFMHCKLGKYREVEKALAEGLAVDTRHGPEDNTMLLTCAMNGQKRIAKLLLRNKANINATNSAGNSSLHLAYQLNYKELGDYLRSKGADDKLRNKKGLTCYEVITV